MKNLRNITPDIVYIGADDRRLALFEGVYSIPKGVSYNSYVILDEKNALIDTVDKAVARPFMENLEGALDGKNLDYIVLHHIEPDHSALLFDIIEKYPDAVIVTSAQGEKLIKQFFNIEHKYIIVGDGDTLSLGEHELVFKTAPMVHWPEVIVSLDTKDKVLFSADAFGTFGALGGALFADEVDFEREYMSEARRYYTNIVGKYGPQVQSLLKKAGALDFNYICPLHGPVWRKDFSNIISKYALWSSYTPEKAGVMIAYASIYTNTEKAVTYLARALFERGIRCQVFDVSVVPESELISAAFEYSNIVLASVTYNMQVFPTMESFIRELVCHNIQNRTLSFIENGSWAPVSAKLMKELFAPCKNMTYLDTTVTVKSALNDDSRLALDTMCDEIVKSIME